MGMLTCAWLYSMPTFFARCQRDCLDIWDGGLFLEIVGAPVSSEISHGIFALAYRVSARARLRFLTVLVAYASISSTMRKRP